MWLKGFDVVNIIKLNLNKTWIRDLATHVSHARMCTRLHVWLKIKDEARSWITINCHQHRYCFYAIFVQPFEYWIAWKGWGSTKGKGFVVPYNNYFTPSQNEVFFPKNKYKMFTIEEKVVRINTQELNLRLWFRGWEEIMNENGYWIFNVKKRCITNYSNFQLNPTQWLMMIQTKMLNYTKKEWSWSSMMSFTKDNNGWASME
jgi:hypothetical protein